MLMNPGATTNPFASMTFFALADLKSPRPTTRTGANCNIGLPRLGARAVVNRAVSMMTSKSCAKTFKTIVDSRKARRKNLRFITRIQKARSSGVDLILTLAKA